MTCKVCNERISDARRTAIPGINTCVHHSEAKPIKGFMTWEHKTAPTFQIVNDRQHEILQRFSRKGVHASLPMDSRKRAESRGEIESVVHRTHPIYEVVGNTIPSASCHPERLRVSSAGKCLECSQQWYAVRLGGAVRTHGMSHLS